MKLICLALALACASAARCPFGMYKVENGICVRCPASRQNAYLNQECRTYWNSLTAKPTSSPTEAPTPAHYNSKSAAAHTLNPTPYFVKGFAPTPKPQGCPAGKYTWSSTQYHGKNQKRTFCLACPAGKWSKNGNGGAATCMKTKSYTRSKQEKNIGLHDASIHSQWKDDYSDTIVDVKDQVRGRSRTRSQRFNKRGIYMPPQNVHYHPGTAERCCANRCSKGKFNKAQKADCRIGCKNWMSKSSLNWVGGWGTRLEHQCSKDCYQPGLWKSLRARSNTVSFWNTQGKSSPKVERMCQRGCAMFHGCVKDEMGDKKQPIFTCNRKINFIKGQRYSQISLTDYCKAGKCDSNPKYGKKTDQNKAEAYCKATCIKRNGCTGFFFQKHNNGHEICGFYSTKVNTAAASRHGHKYGAVCTKN
jgi:hypothetical protein